MISYEEKIRQLELKQQAIKQERIVEIGKLFAKFNALTLPNDLIIKMIQDWLKSTQKDSSSPRQPSFGENGNKSAPEVQITVAAEKTKPS